MARTKEFDPAERLLRARSLFWEKGYQATSMEDLVQGMGLNRGSIYDTYGDKHALFLQCLESYVSEAESCYRAMARQYGSPMQALEQIINKAADTTLQEKKSCMAVKAAFELGESDPEIHQVLKTNADTITRIFAALLTRAQDQGELGKDKDPQVLARLVQCSLSGFWQHYTLYHNPAQVRKLIRQLFALIRA